MKIGKKKIIFSLVSLLILLVFSFIAFNKRLMVNGISSVSSSGWNIYFKNLRNVRVNGDAVEIKFPILEGTKISDFAIAFRKSNDSISYRFTVVNDGKYSARINKIDLKRPTCLGNGTYKENDEDIVCTGFNYNLVYSDGNSVKVGDYLKSNEVKDINLILSFDSNLDINNQISVPKSDVSISDIELKIDYEQAD